MKLKLSEIQNLLETSPSKPEIFYHFKLDWLNIAVALFLMDEREEAKTLVKSAIKELSMEECSDLIDEALALRISHPGIFKHLVPSKTRFLVLLYKKKLYEVLEEKIAFMKKDNAPKFINKIQELNHLPNELLGNVVVISGGVEIMLTDRDHNHFFHIVGLNTIKPTLHFKPELLIQEDFIEADDLIPVKVTLNDGQIHIHLNIIKEHKQVSNYQFKPSEALEGMVSLDAKSAFKIFTYTEKYKYLMAIGDLLEHTPKASLESLFVKYFASMGELKVDGAKVYQEFMNEISFLPEELKAFNVLVQNRKVAQDTAYFLIYLVRISKNTPMMLKPFLNMNELFEAVAEGFDSVTNEFLKK